MGTAVLLFLTISVGTAGQECIVEKATPESSPLARASLDVSALAESAGHPFYCRNIPENDPCYGWCYIYHDKCCYGYLSDEDVSCEEAIELMPGACQERLQEWAIACVYHHIAN